jgi:hypothetical protein
MSMRHLWYYFNVTLLLMLAGLALAKSTVPLWFCFNLLLMVVLSGLAYKQQRKGKTQ